MNTKFYKAEIDENGVVTLSPPDGEDGGIRTGRLKVEDPPHSWWVLWEKTIWEDDRLNVGSLKRRNKPEKPDEYKMHIENKFKWFSGIPKNLKGGKLIFDDKVTGKKWRKLLKAVSRRDYDRGYRRRLRMGWTEKDFKQEIRSLAGEMGFPNLIDEMDHFDSKHRVTERWEPSLESYPKFGHGLGDGPRPHLCSVDSSNRCILYTRDWKYNYLQFTEFIEEKVENPLTAEGAQAEPEPEPELGSSTASESGARTDLEMGGGKKTKKRKRKTKKRNGRKRSSRNLKSKRKNKKYTKRRR